MTELIGPPRLRHCVICGKDYPRTAEQPGVFDWGYCHECAERSKQMQDRRDAVLAERKKAQGGGEGKAGVKRFKGIHTPKRTNF